MIGHNDDGQYEEEESRDNPDEDLRECSKLGNLKCVLQEEGGGGEGGGGGGGGGGGEGGGESVEQVNVIVREGSENDLMKACPGLAMYIHACNMYNMYTCS